MNEQPQVINGQEGLKNFFGKVYAFLGMAIGISALTSFLTMTVFYEQFINIINTSRFFFIALWIIQIGLVVMLGSKAEKNPSLALGGFIGYSALNGITLSVTFLTYDIGSITSGFIAAAVTFGVMAVIGTRTKKDLSAVGQAAYSALIGIIVVMLLNVFLLRSSAVDMLISVLMIIVFSGLTAYDHQKIKSYYAQYAGSESLTGIAIFSALQLYLDFINLLIAFIRIFGRD